MAICHLPWGIHNQDWSSATKLGGVSAAATRWLPRLGSRRTQGIRVKVLARTDDEHGGDAFNAAPACVAYSASFKTPSASGLIEEREGWANGDIHKEIPGPGPGRTEQVPPAEPGRTSGRDPRGVPGGAGRHGK